MLMGTPQVTRIEAAVDAVHPREVLTSDTSWNVAGGTVSTATIVLGGIGFLRANVPGVVFWTPDWDTYVGVTLLTFIIPVASRLIANMRAPRKAVL